MSRRSAATAVITTCGALTILNAGVPVVSAEGATSNLVRNGSFEKPVIVSAQLFTAGQHMGGWQVTGGSVDLLDRSYWPNQVHGNQAIDLAGVADGRIEQSETTQRGASYLLRFFLAANPDRQSYRCNNPRRLVVRFGGKQLAAISVSPVGRTPSDMEWTETSLRVAATASTSTLVFQSETNDSVCGPALDEVSLTKVR